MPYTPNKVVGTDTIRTLTDKVNAAMDGIVTVQNEQNAARTAALDPVSGHKHTGLAGDAPPIPVDGLDSDVHKIINMQQCLQWLGL